MSAESSMPQQPHIVLDENLDEQTRAFVANLEEQINLHPEDYVAAMQSIDELALANILTEGFSSAQEISGDALARYKHIGKFFIEEIAQKITFDETTEQALSDDDEYTDLLARFRSAGPRSIRLPGGTHETISDPKAKELSNEIRIYRVVFYAGRVLAYQEQVKPKMSA